MGNHEEKEKKEENEEQKNQVVKELKVILIGNSGVGKTSLMNGANGINFVEGTQISTLVCSYVKVFLTISGKEYCVNLWDTVGQERFRSLTNAFLNGANIIIFVFDITNEKSFTDLDFWFKYIEDELGPDIAKGIIANKQDLIEEQKVEDEIIENYAKEKEVEFSFCSALTPKVFINFMEKLVINYLKNYENQQINVVDTKSIIIKKSKKSNPKKKRNC